MAGKKGASAMSKKYAGKGHALASIVKDMDLKADRCTDLYQYACGGFIARNTPNDTKPYAESRTFSLIARRNNALQQEILTNIPHEVSTVPHTGHTSPSPSPWGVPPAPNGPYLPPPPPLGCPPPPSLSRSHMPSLLSCACGRLWYGTT